MSTNFDEAAATWDTPEKVERSRRIAEAIAARVPLTVDWVALDYGCGTGQLTWHLAERLGRVILVDTSEGMLDVARAEAARRDPDRYPVSQLDLTTAAPKEPVDLVMSAMTLHHVPQTQALVSGVRGALRPGGWVALADLDADPENLFHDDGYTGHRGIDRDRLADQLRATGFADVTTETAATVSKTKDGIDREFTVFLLTARVPGSTTP